MDYSCKDDFELDFEIELEEKELAERCIIHRRMLIDDIKNSAVLAGTVSDDDVHVYMHRFVYEALEKYAAEDTTKERGAMLLGEYEHRKTDAADGIRVIISDFIEARYAEASAATLTFTHKTWQHVWREREARCPEKRIVGWQHTHPGYGVFLSGYDLFIQKNFFNLPFQVAYVIDPIENTRGFFQWKNEKIKKLGGYYIYDDK